MKPTEIFLVMDDSDYYGPDLWGGHPLLRGNGRDQ